MCGVTYGSMPSTWFVIPDGIEEIFMKGLGGKVACDHGSRACKVTKEKGRARESEQGRKEIDKSVLSISDFWGLDKHPVRCKRIDDIPHCMPGWGCCKCHGYNSYGRKVCKHCGHAPCYPKAEGGSL
jgi:hypothetical protein